MLFVRTQFYRLDKATSSVHMARRRRRWPSAREARMVVYIQDCLRASPAWAYPQIRVLLPTRPKLLIHPGSSTRSIDLWECLQP